MMFSYSPLQPEAIAIPSTAPRIVLIYGFAVHAHVKLPFASFVDSRLASNPNPPPTIAPSINLIVIYNSPFMNFSITQSCHTDNKKEGAFLHKFEVSSSMELRPPHMAHKMVE
jgi:hypothetical protein